MWRTIITREIVSSLFGGCKSSLRYPSFGNRARSYKFRNIQRTKLRFYIGSIISRRKSGYVKQERVLWQGLMCENEILIGMCKKNKPPGVCFKLCLLSCFVCHGSEASDETALFLLIYVSPDPLSICRRSVFTWKPLHFLRGRFFFASDVKHFFFSLCRALSIG